MEERQTTRHRTVVRVRYGRNLPYTRRGKGRGRRRGSKRIRNRTGPNQGKYYYISIAICTWGVPWGLVGPGLAQYKFSVGLRKAELNIL